MQLGFAHRALEPEQQAVVEVAGAVDTILVHDQRIAESADLQQPVPVAAVAGQPRYLQSQHDAGAAQADLGHQLLEALTVRRRGTRLTLVAVDDDDVVESPAQSDGALFEGVLTFRALAVLEDLLHRGLSYVEVGLATQVRGCDLVV